MGQDVADGRAIAETNRVTEVPGARWFGRDVPTTARIATLIVFITDNGGRSLRLVQRSQPRF